MYAAGAQAELVDWGLPAMKGAKAIVEGTAGRWKSAFPTMSGDARIVLDDGARRVAAVVELRGMQKAPFKGPGREVEVHEDTELRLVVLQVLDLDDAGLIARERVYADVGSIYHQFGMSGGSGRRLAGTAQTLPEVRAVAAGDAADAERLALAKRYVDAVNDHKSDEALGLLDDAFVESQQFALGMYNDAQDVDKAAARAALAAGPTPIRADLESSFAAGEWVVSQARLRGSLAGEGGAVPIDLACADVTRIVNGKLTRTYSFCDGLRFAIQSGVFADFAAEEQARLDAPPPPPKPPKPPPPPEPTAEECAKRYQSVRDAMQGEDREPAVKALEAVLADDRSTCRKAATALLADPFFAPLEKDKRLSRLASEIAIDPKRNLVVQVCAGASLEALVDPERGVSFYREAEAVADEAGFVDQGTKKGDDAVASVKGLIAGDVWCFGGYGDEDDGKVVVGLTDHQGSDVIVEPLLADVKDATVCFHRDQGCEYCDQGDVCLVNSDVGWRVAAWTSYPTGPIDPSEYQARAAKRIKAGFKLYGR